MEICDVLNVSKDSLLSFTQKLFAVNIINRDTKISVTRIGGKEGAGILLDHIEMKVEQNPDCLQVVLKLMENDEYLRHIVKKIKGEYEGSPITQQGLNSEQQTPVPRLRRIQQGLTSKQQTPVPRLRLSLIHISEPTRPY